MKRIVLVEGEDVQRIIAERYGVEVNDVFVRYGGCDIVYEVTLEDD